MTPDKEAKELLIGHTCSNCKGMYLVIKGCKYSIRDLTIIDTHISSCSNWQRARADHVMAKEG